MKTPKSNLLNIIIISATTCILQLSCQRVEIKTEVNRDESIHRTYTIIEKSRNQKTEKTFGEIVAEEEGKKTEEKKTDNSIQENSTRQNIFDHELPQLPVDSTWTQAVDYDAEKKVEYTHFSKRYSNFEELQEDYNNKEYKLKPLKPSIEVKKEFKWFTTKYIYKETFHQVFRGVPAREYFTPEELKIIKELKMDEHKELETKVDNWINICMVDELIHIVKENIDQDIDLRQWKVMAINKLREDIAGYYGNDSIKNKPMIPDDREGIMKSIEEVANVTIPEETRDKIFDELDSKLELFSVIFYNSISFKVSLPGEIIHSNSDSIANNYAVWQINGYLSGDPFEMIVQSRTNNYIYWALAGLLVLFLGMFFKKRK